MNHWVPDFDVDDDHQPAVTRNKSFGYGDEIMELLWQDGHVVMQPHQAVKKSPPPNLGNAAQAAPPNGDQHPFMFMQEDEIATWLDHPLNDDADLWPYPNHLPQFLGGDRVGESGAANSNGGSNESTVVDPVPEVGNGGGRSVAATSPGGSSTNGVFPPPPMRKEDTKRQGRETEEGGGEWDSEEYVRRECRRQLKKRDRTSSSLKRTRSAEVHNLSERKRRDRINERMKALQGLIPRCSKVDKASMLEDVIEYVKSLQTQIQLMSMGCGMFPVMLPYMNMGESMNVHLNRPMLFPHMNILGGGGGGGSGSDGGGGWRSAHSLPGNPMPGHHQPHILPSRPSETASTNPSDLMSGSTRMWNQQQCPNSLVDQPKVLPRASRGSYSV